MLTAMLSCSFEESQGCCLFMFPYHFTVLCLLLLCLLSTRPPLSVLTNDNTDFDYHFEVSPSPLCLLFLLISESLQTFTPASRRVMKLCCEGSRIHRFSDYSLTSESLRGKTINSIPIIVYLFQQNVLPLLHCNPSILSNSVTC